MMSGGGAGMADAGRQMGQQFWGGFPGIMQGLFGNSGKPYGEAGKTYQNYYNEGKGYQNPFYDRGVNAGGQFNEWLDGMKDPQEFINKLMGGYSESPQARNMQQQAQRSGTNFASANGLAGSSPMAQQMQQNASNISSGDMNQWLQNVLGVNSQYGQGLFGEMGMGQHASDVLSQLSQNAGEYMGGTRYGQQAGRQNDMNSIWAGIAKMFGG